MTDTPASLSGGGCKRLRDVEVSLFLNRHSHSSLSRTLFSSTSNGSFQGSLGIYQNAESLQAVNRNSYRCLHSRRGKIRRSKATRKNRSAFPRLQTHLKITHGPGLAAINCHRMNFVGGSCMKLSGGQFFIRSVLALLSAVVLAACGAAKSSNSSDLGSRVGEGINSSKTLTYCNKGSSSTMSLKLMAQYNGGSYDPNWAHLRLYNVPSGFDSNANYIQFWKAAANSDSTIAYNASPITFSVFDIQTQQYVKQNLTALRWNDVKDLFAGASVSTFLSRAMFVLSLQDPNGQYTVLTSTAYTSSNGQIQESLNVLLPAFYANPADYAVKSNGMARESVLQNMHPLRNQSGNWATLAQALCN